MSNEVEMGVHLWPSRTVPPQTAVAFAQQMEASGVVDWFQTWDQLVSFYPQALWRPDVTPMAELSGDCDSYYNAGMVAAIAASQTEKLNITTTLDAVRTGPAEILQQMLTIAAGTNARTSIQIGAGELKQCKPFGYKRSQGLSRMEDIFAIIRKLLASDGLVSHEGNHWNYDDAWIGAHRTNIPEFWALGGGPKLMEIAAKYADGFITLNPSAFATPEAWAEQVQSLRHDLERNDRDPDAFTFGLWPMCVVYDTDEEREELLDNPLVKWMAAVFGRLDHARWRDEEGLDLIFPEDFHYAMKLLPHSLSREEVDSIVARVPREMVEKSFYIGTPKEVADQLVPFVEAGANYLAPADNGLGAVPPEKQPRAIERIVEIAAHIKAPASVGA